MWLVATTLDSSAPKCRGLWYIRERLKTQLLECGEYHIWETSLAHTLQQWSPNIWIVYSYH